MLLLNSTVNSDAVEAKFLTYELLKKEDITLRLSAVRSVVFF